MATLLKFQILRVHETVNWKYELDQTRERNIKSMPTGQLGYKQRTFTVPINWMTILGAIASGLTIISASISFYHCCLRRTQSPSPQQENEVHREQVNVFNQLPPTGPPQGPMNNKQKQCTEFLDEQGIEFVTNKENTPNFLHGRPIEKFWVLCKREYGKRKEPAKSLNSFRRIWRNISDKVAQDSGKSLMKGIKVKLSVRDGGPLTPLKVKLPFNTRHALPNN